MCGDVGMVFVGIGAPAVGVGRVVFLRVLNGVIDGCSGEECVFVGGGCGGAGDGGSGGGHAEPRAASRTRLLRLVEARELCGVWRGRAPGHRERVLLCSTFGGSVAWCVFGTLKWFCVEPLQRVHLDESLGFFVAGRGGAM